MEKEFGEKLKQQSKELDILLNEEQIKQFYKYMNLLIEWNQKINLTAITEPEEIIQKHFVDSITIEKYLNKNAEIIDVGTGAGFPGIPLKIIRPDLKITLLDSLNKRVNFLNNVIENLELSSIYSIHARVEEFGKVSQYREKFDVATSRAVANLATLSEYLIPLVKQGGYAISMKGSEVNEEIEQSKKAINILGGKIEKVDTFKLPQSDITRNIIVIKKEKQTPNKYPRKPGTPTKEPIK